MPSEAVFSQMNVLGKQRVPFVFILDAFAQYGLVTPLAGAAEILLFDVPLGSNTPVKSPKQKPGRWDIKPVDWKRYLAGFDIAMHHIARGDSFLINYTQPTLVSSEASLRALFDHSVARYRIHLLNTFTCFSPEPFVTITPQGCIGSHPMKGTAEMNDSLSEIRLLMDEKELAEHHTIVDLIRNDLSRVASQVAVEKFRYTDTISTPNRQIIQVSSHISGQLGADWHIRIGDIFEALLPAGSVTGAPKLKTIEVIKKAEQYNRGWYTGVFGFFNGAELDSGVLIRYIEQGEEGLIYKSGGGLTHRSDPEKEYAELISKVYVPVA